MPRLASRVAVVTGASSGIGAATVRALAAEGAAVVLAARRADRLDTLAAEIAEAGGEALVVPTDVTRRADGEALVAATLERFGRLDVLVNNAGVMPLSFVKNARVDEWQRMVEVNVNGVLSMTGAALPHMTEQKRGHIVNVSSVAGRRVFVGGAVYCATKHAVTAFSEGLHLELGQRYGIRVTCIEPGAVATELSETIADEEFQRATAGGFARVTPLAAETVAEAIVFAVTAPEGASVHEVLVMPTSQPS